MSTYLLAFAASFCYVAAKSWQQLNVVHRKYMWIMPTSWIMAALEVYVVASVARNGWGWLVFWVGFGSGLGSLTATWIHTKFGNYSTVEGWAMWNLFKFFTKGRKETKPEATVHYLPQRPFPHALPLLSKEQ